LALGGGRQVFVKVIAESTNPVGARMYRDEARVLHRMPREAPVPGLLGDFDEDLAGDQWVCLLIEHVDGRAPDLRRPGELDRLVELTVQLAELDPCPVPGLPALAAQAGTFDRWRRVDRADPGLRTYHPWLFEHLERVIATASGWSVAIDGTALAHGDLRPDNILVTDRGAWAVDWPGASVGARWVDTLLMLPALAMLEAGPTPAEVAQMHPLLTGVDPAVIDTALAAALGYFISSSLLDPPTGLPTVRAFQRAQAEVLLGWLQERWA
jgi:aminoglycoside phosphotransferase (APT) family kinase protein